MPRLFCAAVIATLLCAAAARAQPCACAPNEDRNGGLLVGDPLLDTPASLGWFAAVEVDFVGAHIRNKLGQAAPFGNDTIPNLFHLPTADLNWTASPRFEAGYRFGEGAGELLAAYRFLNTSGSDGTLRSRLGINVLDLDYANHEPSLGPAWDMKWRAGVRFAGVFFDSSDVSAEARQRIGNYFDGVGPHAGLDMRRTLDVPGLSLFSRVEGAAPIGHVGQTFDQTFTPAGGPVTGARAHDSQTVTALNLALQAGVSWCWADRLGVTAGYTYEHWWEVGFTNHSRGDVQFQGPFLRAEWKY